MFCSSESRKMPCLKTSLDSEAPMTVLGEQKDTCGITNKLTWRRVGACHSLPSAYGGGPRTRAQTRAPLPRVDKAVYQIATALLINHVEHLLLMFGLFMWVVILPEAPSHQLSHLRSL